MVSRPEDDGGFLSRWSRRKQAIAKGLPSAEPHMPSEAASDPAVERPETLAAELPLPSLEDVVPGGDISAFLQKHVPDSLRNLALRKAWESDPVISTFIEMADYQLDYANPDSIPGWSSTLEGVDVKKFVDALFQNMPEQEAATPDIAAFKPDLTPQAPENAQKYNDEFIITNSEAAEIAGHSDPTAVASLVPDADPSYVAVQNNPEDSSVYLRQKRRHGSALPS